MQRFYALLIFGVLLTMQLAAQSADCLNIYLSQSNSPAQDTLLVDVRARNFRGVLAMQYTCTWDSTALQLVGVSNFGIPGLNSSNFSLGSTNIAKGLLSIAWNRLDSIYLADDSRLYTIKFVAKRQDLEYTRIRFVDTPVPSEVVYTVNYYPIPGLIGLNLRLMGDTPSSSLRITQLCSAINDCRDTLGSAALSVEGGTAPYTYFWQGEKRSYQTQNIAGAFPGTYQLWVIDANLDSVSALVGVSSSPYPGGGLSLSSNVLCDDPNQAQARLTVFGYSTNGQALHFAWSNGFSETAQNISSIRAPYQEVFSVTVTDPNGCQGTLYNLSAKGSCYQDPIGTDTTFQDTIAHQGANLSVGSKIVKPGEIFCTPVKADHLNALSGLQFSLKWDTDKLHFQKINYTNSAIDLNSLGFAKVDEGILRFVKVYFPSITYEDETLFEVCFTGQYTADSLLVYFESGDLPGMAVDSLQNLIPLNTYNGTIFFQPALWPGDADGNGVVDQFDLLPLGLAYGSTGTARNNPKITWEAQPTQKWGQNLVNSTIDLAFVDADGNGLIDAADTVALARNWQRRHNDGLPKLLGPEIRKEGAPIFLKADTVLSGPGQWFPLELGTADQLAENVYGLAFSVTYDPAQVKEMELNFRAENSWLGTLGQNLIAFQRNNTAYNRIDVALTRIDGRNVNGFGRVGQVKITIEDVILNLREEEFPKLKLGIENVRMITSADQIIPVAPLASETVAKRGVSTSTYDPYLQARIRVYPQPANNQLYLDYGNLPLKSIQLLQMDGKALSGIMAPTRSLSLNGIPNGVYLLKVVGEKGVAMKKVLIAR